MSSDRCVVLITCSSKKEAEKITDFLLNDRLAACVNMVEGIRSSYWWQGKIESAEEILLLVKTSRRKFKEIVKQVAGVHSYQTPEIIAIPIIAGNKPYLAWIDENLKPHSRV